MLRKAVAAVLVFAAGRSRVAWRRRIAAEAMVWGGGGLIIAAGWEHSRLVGLVVAGLWCTFGGVMLALTGRRLKGGG